MDKPNKDEFKEESTDEAKVETKASWDHINTDLKGAIDTWTDLTGKLANKLSPDEVQLREIKSILVTLKDQLKVFNDEEPEESPKEDPSSENKL
ncbi:MAG: hypothetical protein ACXVBQ_02075 [Pseudobdellovibrionaceae bacterium]